MTRRVAHAAFDAMHPAVPALYACVTLGLTMFSMQPVLVGLSLIGASAYLACARGPAAALSPLRWQIPVVAVVALVNPLFVRMGSTVLFELFGRPVFLESLLYGLTMAGLFMATAQWFAACSHLLSYDKVMGLLGNAAPVVALMVSMTMRLVPRLLRQGKTIASVQDVALSCAPGEPSLGLPLPLVPGASGRLPLVPGASERVLGGRRVVLGTLRRLRQSSVLMGWAMEDSLETANAMRARGWGARPRRTTYVPYRFGAQDACALALLAVCGSVCAWAAWDLTSPFGFYPRLTPLEPSWGYVLFAAWMLVPTVLHIYEERKFA